MTKFAKNQRVIIKQKATFGVVIQVLPNPFVPTWLMSPNYLVLEDGYFNPDVYRQKQLKKIKKTGL